jgi:hypothetical protein
MDFKIESQLDLSDGFDEDSLLGKIRLSDGVHSIAEESVYLDSWLDALWAGSRTVRNSSSKFAIDIREHSQPLRVHRDRTGAVHVAFRDTEVIAPSTDEFEQAVLSAIARFTDEVSNLSGKEYELPGSERG